MCGATMSVEERACDAAPQKARDLARAWVFHIRLLEALRDLDQAMRNFFRRARLKKEGKWKGPPGYPTFKSKKKGLGSFR